MICLNAKNDDKKGTNSNKDVRNSKFKSSKLYKITLKNVTNQSKIC